MLLRVLLLIYFSSFSFLRYLYLFSYYLYQDPLLPPAIELGIEDLLPWSEVQLPVGDSNYDFPSHDGPLEVGIAVILSGTVMPVFRYRLMRG